MKLQFAQVTSRCLFTTTPCSFVSSLSSAPRTQRVSSTPFHPHAHLSFPHMSSLAVPLNTVMHGQVRSQYPRKIITSRSGCCMNAQNGSFSVLVVLEWLCKRQEAYFQRQAGYSLRTQVWTTKTVAACFCILRAMQRRWSAGRGRGEWGMPLVGHSHTRCAPTWYQWPAVKVAVRCLLLTTNEADNKHHALAKSPSLFETSSQKTNRRPHSLPQHKRGWMHASYKSTWSTTSRFNAQHTQPAVDRDRLGLWRHLLAHLG